MPDEWTLNAWIEDEKDRLDAFAAFWRRGQSGEERGIDPEAFPAVMPNGEWDEQYRGWCE